MILTTSRINSHFPPFTGLLFKTECFDLESPDFNRKTVGKWTQLFEAPENNQSIETSVRQRLSNFMPLAFRSSVDRETIDRYVSYALNMINKEKSFELGMKRTISGVLSSPLFLFRHETIAGDKAYRLASDLSFMLWGSGPDHQLLKAAESGKILDESYLRQTFERMINDLRFKDFSIVFHRNGCSLKMHLQLLLTQILAVTSPLIKTTQPASQWFWNPSFYLMLFFWKIDR